MDGGGRGREGQEDTCLRRLLKSKTPPISCASLHLRKGAGNQSKLVKLKTGSTVFLQRKKACRVEE